MTEKEQPKSSAQPAPKRNSARDDRLKAALKSNMAKRKAQARARQSADKNEE